jgi:hypothetical protein
MTRTITAAFIALSMTATAQRDSLVCFTVSEAYEILDTLHSGIDHRRARIILGTMYAKQVQVSKSYAIEADSLRSWRKADQWQTAEALRIRDQAVKDAEFWKGKAKGKGWRGFGLGILVSIGAYISTQQLTR